MNALNRRQDCLPGLRVYRIVADDKQNQRKIIAPKNASPEQFDA
jgi:hypothetical protein